MNTATGANATISDPASFFRRLSSSIGTPHSNFTSTQQINRAEPTTPRLGASAQESGDLRKNIEANVIVLLNAIDRVAIRSETVAPEVQRGIGEAIRIIDSQLGILKTADPVMFSTLNQAFELSIDALNGSGYGYDKSGHQS